MPQTNMIDHALFASVRTVYHFFVIVNGELLDSTTKTNYFFVYF